MDGLIEDYQLKEDSFFKKWKINYLLFAVIDLISIVLAFQCSYLLYHPGGGSYFFSENDLLFLLLGTLPFWVLILNLIKFTGIPTKRYKVLFIIYFNAALIQLLVYILIDFFSDTVTIPGNFLISTAFLGYFFLFVIRIFGFIIFRNTGSKRHVYLNLVIIADDSSLPFIENQLAQKGSGFRIFVIFTESDLIKQKFEKEIIILSEQYLGILNDLIEVDLIDEVLFLKEKFGSDEVREVIRTCEELGVTFRLRYTNPVINLSSAVTSRLASEKFLSFKKMRNNTFAHALKRTIDINIAVLTIVLLSPVFVLLSIWIKLSSKGPLIVKQSLAGIRGRQINLYRFRTFSVNAKKLSTNGAGNKPTNDTATVKSESQDINKTASFLLKSGLDRLPQLFNILNGDILILGIHPSLRREDL
jgi:lipopolysaccharide/colanic/teichoic acid biosynthesis glycosyltransferase